MISLQDLKPYMSFQQVAALEGCAFKARDFMASLNGTRYYRVTVPAGVSIILTGRGVSGDAGPIDLARFPDATGISVVGPILAENIRGGGNASQITIEQVSVSTPGDPVKIDISRGSAGGLGIRQSGTIGEAINDIFPPGVSVVFGIDTNGAGINKVFVKYDWIEVEGLEPKNA